MEPLEPYRVEQEADDACDWDATDRRDWIANGAACSVVIAIADGSWPHAAVWLMATVVRAWYGMPAVARAARRWSAGQKSLSLDVALGWALYPGPLAGSFFGAIIPPICNLPVSSFQGALIGLIAGPLVAAVVGVALVTLVLGVFWGITGKWPDFSEVRRQEQKST